MTLDSSGPTSRIYFSQRLRLHYVDWGNPGAPPLLLVHGGRDHCRNWDWVAAALRRDWHVLAPDLRGHGDSQWSPDGNYSMAAYIYDLAQLIHQQELAPVTIIGHSLGGMIALRYTGIYPENVRKLVAIEGLGVSPRRMVERARQPIADRMRHWIDEQRALSGRMPRRYASIDDALKRMQEANRAPLARAGAAPDPVRRQPERGRHLQLEIRQLRPRRATLRDDPGRDRGAVVAHCLPDPPGLRQGELGLQPGAGRPHPPFRQRQGRVDRERRPLGPPRPARRLSRSPARLSLSRSANMALTERVAEDRVQDLVAGRDAEARRGAAVQLDDRANRRGRGDHVERLGHGALMDVDDSALRVDEQHVERDQRVAHPHRRHGRRLCSRTASRHPAPWFAGTSGPGSSAPAFRRPRR